MALKTVRFILYLAVLITIVVTSFYKTRFTFSPLPRIFIEPAGEPSINSSSTPILVKTPRRYAIFSSSIHSKLRSYIFYTPIAAAAWQQIGYEVIVVFVGDFTSNISESSSIQLNLTRVLLKKLNVKVIDFQCDKDYATKISQLVRIFIGFLSNNIVDETDMVLTSDSDIIPIQGQDYELTNNANGFIYNSYCCGSFQRRNKTYEMYPLSHICLSKKLWRDLFLESTQRNELIHLNISSINSTLLTDDAPFSFETISLYTRHEFGHLYDSNMTKGDSAWYMDQIYSSMLLNDYLQKHTNIKIDKRRKYSRRLDPQDPYQMWETRYLHRYGDAHLIHDEIFHSYRWAPLKNLLLFLFHPSLVNDFDLYYKAFLLQLRTKPDDY